MKVIIFNGYPQCPKCETELEENQKKCPKCGQKLYWEHLNNKKEK